MSLSILLVEDDDRLAPLVLRHLKESGFDPHWASDAQSAWAALDTRRFELAILDVMLPGEDGLSLCRRIRRQSDIGIIMVTARGQESDRILGLDLGADDYLPKPFSLWELEARIKAVLRRYSPGKRQDDSNGIFIDTVQRTISVRGRKIELTRAEFDLLAKMIEEPGRVFTREALLDCIKGGDTDAFDRAVDTHVSNLRRKIEDDPKEPVYLKTVWGVGYRFERP